MCVCVCVGERERERERERDVLCFVCRCEDVILIHQILQFDLTFFDVLRFTFRKPKISLKITKCLYVMSHSHNNNNNDKE